MPPPQLRIMFWCESAMAWKSGKSVERETRDSNASAGIQFEPFTTIGTPLNRKKNALPPAEAGSGEAGALLLASAVLTWEGRLRELDSAEAESDHH